MPHLDALLRHEAERREPLGAPPFDGIVRGSRHRRRGKIVAVVVTTALVVAVPEMVAGGHRPRPAATQGIATGRTEPPVRPSDQSLATTALPGDSSSYSPQVMLVGSGLLRSPDSGSVTVTFTPRSWQLTLAVACPPEWDNAATTAAVLLINGHVDSAGGCSSTMTAPAATWQSFGLRLDRPATVTLTLVRGPLGRGILTAPPSVPPMQPSAQRPQGDVTVDVYDGGPADSSHGVIAGVVRQYGGPPLPNGHMADEGVPVSGETVGIESSRAITGKDGSFAIELRPGHYTLHGCQDVSVDVVAGVVTPVDVVCAIP